MNLFLVRRKFHVVKYAMLSVLIMSAAPLFFSCGSGSGSNKLEPIQASKPLSLYLSSVPTVQCSDAATIAAGMYHTVGLKEDGTVVAAGYTAGYTSQDQTISVSSWTKIKAVAAGAYHTVGLNEDGTVVAVGNNGNSQLEVSSWTNIKAIASGANHTVGLKEDGTVVAAGYTAGYTSQDQTISVSSWTNIKAVAAGMYHTVGLKEDGTVVAVGFNGNHQLEVSSWTNIKAIAAGMYHTVGLKEDGTVVAVGLNGNGQTNVSSWTNIKAIAAGKYHTVGLQEDGTVVAVGNPAGYTSTDQTISVSSWTNIKAIASGAYHTVGLNENGTAVAVGDNTYDQSNVSSLFASIMPVCEQDITPPISTATTISPPISTATTISSLSNNGWYVSDVQMILTAADNIGGSGVKEIHYTVDGTETVVQGSSVSLSIVRDGNHAVTYYAIDNAGNVETPPHDMSINIDETPPTAPSLSASPSILWPPDHKMMNVLIGGSIADSGSGIASTIITVTDEYGIYNMTVPGFGSVIQLESWRKDTDMDGRLYTITAVITDKAGNQSTATTTVLVPHDACPGPYSEDRLRGRHHHDQDHHDKDKQHDHDYHDKYNQHDQDCRDKDKQHDQDHRNQAHR